MMKRTFFGVLPFVAYLSNISINSLLDWLVEDFITIMLLVFSSFKRNIFG